MSRSEPEQTAVNKFFKIILLPTIERNMMQVPARFVRLGPKLSDNVTLETPSGFKCLIRIKRIGNEVWFENGWSEFVKAHSISEGHCLYFNYKGNSSFDVVIFDLSASEIEYPMEEELDVIDQSDHDNKEEVMDYKFVNLDNDTSEEVIGSDEYSRKNNRVNIKPEVIILDD